MVICLAHFADSLNFKAIFFSLWLLVWNNLKTYSFSLAFPEVRPFPASVESIHIREEGEGPRFSSPAFVISFCLGHRGLCFAGEQRCSFFFFIFNLTHWIFIRWWILPQWSVKGIKIVHSQLSATHGDPNYCKPEVFLPGEGATSSRDFPRQSPVLRAAACQTSPLKWQEWSHFLFLKVTVLITLITELSEPWVHNGIFFKIFIIWQPIFQPYLLENYIARGRQSSSAQLTSYFAHLLELLFKPKSLKIHGTCNVALLWAPEQDRGGHGCTSCPSCIHSSSWRNQLSHQRWARTLPASPPQGQPCARGLNAPFQALGGSSKREDQPFCSFHIERKPWVHRDTFKTWRVGTVRARTLGSTCHFEVHSEPWFPHL